MAKLTLWPKVLDVFFPLPSRIKRPCDYGLDLAAIHLETQLGTIEAYNRIVEKAEQLKRQIDNGEAKAQNPIYAKVPRGTNGKRPENATASNEHTQRDANGNE